MRSPLSVPLSSSRPVLQRVSDHIQGFKATVQRRDLKALQGLLDVTLRLVNACAQPPRQPGWPNAGWRVCIAEKKSQVLRLEGG